MSATNIIINDETPRRQYVAAAGQVNFDFPFPVFAAGDIVVYKTPFGSTPSDTADILTITTDYTVSGADTQASCKVTLNTGATAGDIITIIREVDLERTTDYQIAGDLLAETLNREQDTEIMALQQLRAGLDRALQSPVTDSTASMVLPSIIDRADKLLQFDTNGSPSVVSINELIIGLGNATVSANYVTNSATGDGSTTAYALSTAPGSKTNVQVYIDGVYQNKASFSLSGTTLTFTEAPPLNASVEFMIGYAVGTTGNDAEDITYNQGDVGHQTRTVESRLQDIVSVKDFGAVGDGVTDDTAAFSAAWAASNPQAAYVPAQSYSISGTVTGKFFSFGVVTIVDGTVTTITNLVP